MKTNIYWNKFLVDGDSHSFSEVYKKYVNSLYAYGISLNFDSELCLDAIQDVFYKLYSRRIEFRDVSDIKFYLFRSIRNRLYDLKKKQDRLQSLDLISNRFDMEVSISHPYEEDEESLLLKQKIESLLKLLTDRQREAIYLRYMQNLEYIEIAKIMDVNPESARKMVYRALEQIRKTQKHTNHTLFTIILQLFI